jgi:hypothetical protein
MLMGFTPAGALICRANNTVELHITRLSIIVCSLGTWMLKVIEEGVAEIALNWAAVIFWPPLWTA